MDRVYKHDIPAARKALEELRAALSELDLKTDWTALRVDPLLQHARTLERLLLSPRFARETSRLPRGVSMFRSDLVYLRDNVRTLRAIVEAQRGRRPRGPAAKPRRRRTK